ncbi:MAG TPA: hypothetical protein VJ276_11030 [Thermoanaerobaculia bacterium]|nr:hypothetical protein [Thermoanaerobaculia bacterium]
MKMLISMSLVVLLAATSAFAHGGHAHTYLGTVTMLHTKTQFMMKASDGKSLTIDTTPKTAWLHADGHAAKRSELVVGTRVVVKMNKDNKTAASVKMSAPAKAKAK